MTSSLAKPQPVDIAHSFDIWRQVTNLILRDLGDVETLTVDLSEYTNVVDAVNFVYLSTQFRLRHILIKSIGMS